ncbi:uncharacterized protein LACBIDRAFT_327160 [Laccaria bicolor S238N-H82]|uniref:Predicted protein n=1 Tax=Laccaria bicolor (strain S238N-H82 / ATCC MYA-4686) TaxID=486041 RepID=B0DBC5_LACBS|nr:uncharacterized protein LACBIDRAFT_327160 [Laccaria bicolor S238N-H82]EDR08167.1 predicted protein [Laccaria bicolor S238N-H82]|eukprot:XP_001881237.1 predicted protein [Laccaria bicolor S238N-H82]
MLVPQTVKNIPRLYFTPKSIHPVISQFSRRFYENLQAFPFLHNVILDSGVRERWQGVYASPDLWLFEVFQAEEAWNWKSGEWSRRSEAFLHSLRIQAVQRTNLDPSFNVTSKVPT